MSLVERAMDKIRHGQPVGRRAGVPEHSSAEPIGALVEHPDTSASKREVVIDRVALRAAGYLPDERQNRRFADEYRQIKRPLLQAAFPAEPHRDGPDPRLIMMASALPGDGKTFTSINLALSMAREKDYSVILVDADVAKPHISRIFGVQAELGLLDLLADPALDPDSLVLPTDVRGLSILSAGPVREGATELLSSRRMQEVARHFLRTRPRCVVLFDSPPLVVSSESRALAVSMGQVVLVVRAGYTPHQALLDAIDHLPEDKSVSMVLNQGRHSVMSGYYGYTYGSYGEDATETA